MPMLRTLAIASLLLVALAAHARAASLAPRHASDIVTLVTSGTPCPFPVAGDLLFDRQIRPDGTNVPFTVPAGKVLVVTGYEFRSVTPYAGRAVAGLLFPATSGVGDQRWAVGEPVVLSGANVVIVNTQAPNLTFKTDICLETADGVLPGPVSSGIVHGFLAPDR